MWRRTKLLYVSLFIIIFNLGILSVIRNKQIPILKKLLAKSEHNRGDQNLELSITENNSGEPLPQEDLIVTEDTNNRETDEEVMPPTFHCCFDGTLDAM